jgi:hypothetical protein
MLTCKAAEGAECPFALICMFGDPGIHLDNTRKGHARFLVIRCPECGMVLSLLETKTAPLPWTLNHYMSREKADHLNCSVADGNNYYCPQRGHE